MSKRSLPGFVWPPRRPPVEAIPGRSTHDPKPERTPEESTSSRPPLRLHRPEPVPTPLAPKHVETTRARLARVWSEIEHTWFDVTAAPLAERMAEEYWTPDAIGDYCPRCGLTAKRHELREGACESCRSGEVARPPWQRLVRLGEYEAPLSQWICEVKFTRWRRLGWDLGRLLGQSLLPQIHAARALGQIPDSPPLIVPVPMSMPRRLLRGIDHTKAVARGVADATGGRVIQPIRRDHRPSQTHVAPSRREANVANSVHPRAPWLRPSLSGRLVIVVDDVTTTTSTLRAACRSVAACDREEREKGGESQNKGKPAAIWAAVLARTAEDAQDHPEAGGA